MGAFLTALEMPDELDQRHAQFYRGLRITAHDGRLATFFYDYCHELVLHRPTDPEPSGYYPAPHRLVVRLDANDRIADLIYT
jgi:hypothetical protein